MIPPQIYKCPKCSKLLTRTLTKKKRWIKTFCSEVGRDVHAYKKKGT